MAFPHFYDGFIIAFHLGYLKTPFVFLLAFSRRFAKMKQAKEAISMTIHHSFQLWFLLFRTFLKIGAFTFGGGYAMIPIVDREVVINKRWLTELEMLDLIAIAESTPGPIAVNTATFVGYKVGGFWGAFFATLGLALPSLVIIYLISLVYHQFMANPLVQRAFQGILAAVALFLLSAVTKLNKTVRKHRIPVVTSLLTLLAFILVFFTGIRSIFLILGAGVLGSLFLHGSPKSKEKES
jgi:chromate transporter